WNYINREGLGKVEFCYFSEGEKDLAKTFRGLFSCFFRNIGRIEVIEMPEGTQVLCLYSTAGFQ
ncbi:MAG: hypothetical protein IKP53_08900, partial [Candidatus Methanomethylophilaceae archaeon]|nr:hypothetical protein [Candidatus Methanomethylophilaceae archaeon]